MSPKTRVYLERAAFVLLGILLVLAFGYFNTAHAQTLDVDSRSNSTSTSTSGSNSAAGSSSDQTQVQGQSQGNNQNITFEAAEQRYDTKQEFRTNTAVPLAASVSFSSDYCGGTASGGASSAALGISLGASKPIMDGNCQSLRRAEKFGMMAVTAKNMGSHDIAARLLAMSIWELCTGEVNQHPKFKDAVPATQQGCQYLGLVARDEMPNEPNPMPSDPEAAAKEAATQQSNAAGAEVATPPPARSPVPTPPPVTAMVYRPPGL